MQDFQKLKDRKTNESSNNKMEKMRNFCLKLMFLKKRVNVQDAILLEHELDDQREVHKQLKAYVGEVLSNIMMTNPQVLERK